MLFPSLHAAAGTLWMILRDVQADFSGLQNTLVCLFLTLATKWPLYSATAEIATSREPEEFNDSWSRFKGTSISSHLLSAAEEDSWCCCLTALSQRPDVSAIVLWPQFFQQTFGVI